MNNISYNRPALNEDGSVKNNGVSLLEFLGVWLGCSALLVGGMFGCGSLMEYTERTKDYTIRNYVLIAMFSTCVGLSIFLVRLMKRAKETMNHEVILELKADVSTSILDIVPAVIGPIWNGEYALSVNYHDRHKASLSVSVNNKTPEVLGSIMKAIRENGISVTRNQSGRDKDFAPEYR